MALHSRLIRVKSHESNNPYRHRLNDRRFPDRPRIYQPPPTAPDKHLQQI